MTVVAWVVAQPPDALTASASGRDLDIGPAYAHLQLTRVAHRPRPSHDRVRDVVQAHTQGRTLGFLGEERVDVLELNLAPRQLTSAGEG